MLTLVPSLQASMEFASLWLISSDFIVRHGLGRIVNILRRTTLATHE